MSKQQRRQRVQGRADFVRGRKQRVTKERTLRVGLYGVGVMVSMLLLAYLMQWNTLQFREVFVLGADEIPGETVKTAVSDYLASPAGVFFTNSSMLLFRGGALKKQLTRTFPQIADINVNRILTDHAVEITITERDPWALYCRDQSCAYISEDGVAYARTLASDSGLLTLIRGVVGGTTELGNVWCDEVCRTHVRVLKNELEVGAALGPLAITYGDGGTLIATTQQGWEIRMMLEGDIPRVAENIRIALEATIKDRRKSLEYIDARFGDRVHYQYK